MYISSIKNIYARPGVSKINGVGMIAIRYIPKNTKIFPVSQIYGCWRKEKDLRKDNVHGNIVNMLQDFYCNKSDPNCDSVFCPIDEASNYLPQNLMNHSLNPNTKICDGFIVSTYNILEGQEITENYIDICGTDYVKSRKIM
tara:strand:- start:4282 stop:4707 length:426 start_codon:yes stop_codon:yes gene_type:complete